jgi:hypothetical protein
MGRTAFVQAQAHVMVVLLIAYVGNNWEYSYPRNDNHSYAMFWAMNAAVMVAGLVTLQYPPVTPSATHDNRKMQLLSSANRRLEGVDAAIY